MVSPISPANTWALLIGIDEYSLGPDWKLPNPTRECIRLAQWLIGKGVSHNHIKLFVKTTDSVALGEIAELQKSGVICVEAAANSIRDDFHQPPFDLPVGLNQERLLYVYWSGHGVTSGDHFQYLTCTEARLGFFKVFNFEEIRKQLRSPAWKAFGNQAFLVNACATYPDAKTQPVPENFPATPAVSQQIRQFAICSATPGHSASADEAAFFGILLNAMKSSCARTLLPDPENLYKSIGEGYKDLAPETRMAMGEPRGYFDLWSKWKKPVISFGDPKDKEVKLQDFIFDQLFKLRRPLSHYIWLYTKLVKRPKDIQQTADIIRDLSEFEGSEWHLAEFYERVIAGESNAQRLQQLIEPYISDIPKLLGLRKYIEDHPYVKEKSPTYLYVFVTSRTAVSIECWLVTPTAAIPEKKVFQVEEGEIDKNPEETICKVVDSFLFMHQGKEEILNSHLEFFLPLHLMGFTAIKATSPTDSFSRIEEVFLVKLRWLHRAVTENFHHNHWKKLSEIIHKGAALDSKIDQKIKWFEATHHPTELSFHNWKTKAETNAFAGLKFNPVSGNPPVLHALLKQALEQGVPYLFWSRKEDECPPGFVEKINQAVKGKNIDEIPDALQKIRGTPNKPPDHPGQHLTVFWDDPRRNPFELNGTLLQLKDVLTVPQTDLER
ncbi:MAG: caspase family protein [Blastocatellia bacterium]|nr:caspase family protein [Blastocatellia bacterium]